MEHKIKHFRGKIFAARGSVAVAALTSGAYIMTGKGYFVTIKLCGDEF